MSIVTTNPARITVQLIGEPNLEQSKIFKLAQFIDAYEIEKQLQETLVIDIYRISKTGRIELVLTPRGGLTYDELSDHLDKAISFALKSVDMEECKWEIVNISFKTEMPGHPSYVFEENVHKAFKKE